MGFIKHVLSFAAGELSPWLDGRTDLDKYGAGCRSLLNFIALPQGAIQKRPGMEYLGSMDPAATAGRLVEFQVSTTEAAMLVIGGGELAVYADGVPALDGGVPIVLAVPWSDADLELLRWKQINSVCYFVHPDHAPRRLTRYAADDWEMVEVDFSLSPALLPENINEAHTVSTVFTTGGTPAAWSASSVSYAAGVRVTHSGKTWVCMKAHVSGAAKAPGSGTATYTENVIVAGRVTQTVTKPLWVEGFADTSAVVGQIIDLTASLDTWQAGHVGAVFEISKKRESGSYEVDLRASGTGPLYSNTLVIQGGWTLETFGTWQGAWYLERSLDRGATWEEIRKWKSDGERNISAEGEEEKRVLMRIKWDRDGLTGTLTKPLAVLASTDPLIRGLVRITAVTNARAATAEVLAPVEKTTTYNWAESAWNEVQGYPRTVELHQARLVMASTTLKPHTVWGSAVDDYEKFYPGTDADEGYRHTVAIGERDPILWLVSERFLLIGTGAGEWIMHGEDEEKAITPEFGVAKRHSSYGAHNGGVPACFADSVSLFVQRGGTRVREFSYRFEADRYEAANLNLLADHLFTAPVDDIAVQRMPWQVVWFVSGGKLYGLTFERAQNVAAWHRHETAGDILSVATIRATGTEDEVWFLVDRGQGAIFIERFRPGHMDALPDDGWWQDSAVALPYPHDLGDAAHLDGLEITGHANGENFGPVELAGTGWPFLSAVAMAWSYDPVNPDAPQLLIYNFFRLMGTRNGKPWFQRIDEENDFIQWVTADGDPRWISFVAGDEWAESREDTFFPQDATAWDALPANIAALPPSAPSLGYLRHVQNFGKELMAPPPVWGPLRISGVTVPDLSNIELVPIAEDQSTGAGLYYTGENTTHSVTLRVTTLGGGQWRMAVRTLSPSAQIAEFRSNDEMADPMQATGWFLHSGSATGLPVLTAPGLPGSTTLVAGLPYSAEVQPMTPEIPLANGSSRSRELRVHRLALSLRDSRGGKMGDGADSLDPLEVGTITATFTGETEREFNGGHGVPGDVLVVSDDPFPFAIRTLALKLQAFGDAD